MTRRMITKTVTNGDFNAIFTCPICKYEWHSDEKYRGDNVLPNEICPYCGKRIDAKNIVRCA